MSSADTVALLKRVKILLLFSLAGLVLMTVVRIQRAFVGDDDEEVAMTYSRPENAPLVAVVACVKQKDWHRPADFLEQSLLPSIYKTITPNERRKYRVELILGYDHDDEYWGLDEHHQLSPKSHHEPIFTDQEPIRINYISIRKDPNGERPNRIPFNELCQAAYEYGATYIVRINDDSEFFTPGWVTVATKALSKFSPPNVGVVGPTCRDGNQDIMTHDMVHAPTHYSIFDTYYAEEFDNYYVDDWISNVYGKERTKKLGKWEVKHHFMKFATRYEPTFHQDQLLSESLAEGTRRVEQFLSKINGGEKKKQRDELRVLGTDTIERVDGPMQEVHLSLMEKPYLRYSKEDD